MSGWLVLPYPEGDPERVHVVPAADDHPDPEHEPSPDCPCRPRICAETSDVDLVTREIVVHHGPN